MPQSPQKRQKALQKQAAKRKQKSAVERRQQSAVPGASRNQFTIAASWELLETLMTRAWDTPTGLVEIMVARQAPDGRVATSIFLVDLGCLGIKDAFWRIFPSVSDYQQSRSHMLSVSDLVETDINLAAKVIRDAAAYASDLGFSPQADFYIAARLLSGANPDASNAVIPLGGEDGKPLYFSGPYDNAQAIVARLTDKVGADGFHFIIGSEFLE